MLPFSSGQFLLPCIMSLMHRAQSENTIKNCFLIYNIVNQVGDTSLGKIEIIYYRKSEKLKFSFRERLLEYFILIDNGINGI